MTQMLGALADRLLSAVVPATRAGACPCLPGEYEEYCQNGNYYRCQLNCNCRRYNCRLVGRGC